MKSKTIPLIIALIVIIAGIYWYSSSRTGNESPLIVNNDSQNQVQTKFQTLVVELSSISFNTSIFSDERFNALVDITAPISPEPVGRLDPFAVVTGVRTN